VEKLDHDRDFHGAGRVERVVTAEEILCLAIEREERDRHVCLRFFDTFLNGFTVSGKDAFLRADCLGGNSQRDQQHSAPAIQHIV
jgi:hypothetical protein